MRRLRRAYQSHRHPESSNVGSQLARSRTCAVPDPLEHPSFWNGALRLVADEPGLFIERQGAARDPWPSDSSLQSLRGRAAGRAVRALVDFRPPYGVRELAARTSTPLGTLSRTLDVLDREGLVTRDRRGPVVDLDWEAALRRWAQDYDVARSNRTASFLEPRGLAASSAGCAPTRA